MPRHQARALPLPFLGGPLSAALLGLCFEPFHSRVLVWIALVPLFFSLWRSRSRPGLRLAHGLSFGWILAAFSLSWMFEEGGSVASVLHGAVVWTVPAFLVGVFALAAGPVFRFRSSLLTALALPGLWTGLDVIRGYVLSGASPWAGQWLSLGYGLSPDAPETQVASLVGVYGLGFLITANSTFLFLVLRESRAWKQIVWAAAGALLPLACQTFGHQLRPTDPADDALSVVVAAQEEADLDGLLALSDRLRGQPTDLIVWPPLPSSLLPKGPDGSSEVPPAVIAYATRAHASLVTLRSPPGSGRVQPAAVEVIVLGPDGRPGLVAEEGSAPLSGSSPWVVDWERGKLALAPGTELLAPFSTREAVERGAEVLVVSAVGVEARHATARSQLTILGALRAIENHRPFVWSGRNTAFLIDPWGRRALKILSGVDSAGSESIPWKAGETFYSAWGGLLEAVWALLAVSLLLVWITGGRSGGSGKQPCPVDESPALPWWYRDSSRVVPEPGYPG